MVTTGHNEDDLADAILSVTDEGLSINKAAQQYGVPRSTISSRLHGRGAQKDQVQPQQRVTGDYEARIKEWVLRQESLGCALSHSQIRAGVEALLKQRGDNTPLGVN
jgi:transposase-like protein